MARNTNNALGYKYTTTNKKNSHYKMQSLVGKQHSAGMFHSECHTHNKTVMTRKDWKGGGGGVGGVGVEGG